MAASLKALVISQVIGDVIDEFVPSVSMSLCYCSKNIINGSEIKPSMAIHPPQLLISGNPDELFTLVMTDPDAPMRSQPTMRELVHWIVVNIPGGTSPISGEEILGYAKPEPEVGVHRIVFVLFKQNGVLKGVVKPESRNNFSTRTFANTLGLGQSVATIYFNVRKEPANKKA